MSDVPPKPDGAPEGACASTEADANLAAAVEALLFSHGAPVTAQRLAEALDADARAVQPALDELETRYSASGSGLRLARIAGGFQLTTRMEWRGAIERLLAPKREQALTEPAIEALSVIAYRQPITVPELNEIRGVNSQSVIATLMKHRLIRSRGRKQVVGRPLLYGTTKEFLERFELDRLEDLPNSASSRTHWRRPFRRRRGQRGGAGDRCRARRRYRKRRRLGMTAERLQKVIAAAGSPRAAARSR